MKRIGFIISEKENEKRRAITFEDAKKIKNRQNVYFQTGYGKTLGVSDEEFTHAGFQILPKEEILKMEILCDPKIGDALYLDYLLPHQTIFGWVHAVQNHQTASKIIKAKASAYAWENMHYQGRHSFWRNNELAGEAAVMDAFLHYGELPYNCKVAVLGRGNTAKGAIRILTSLGAEIHVYDRKKEKLFQEEMKNYDVIVNAVLWNYERNNHIIYQKDLRSLKRNAMIIDVSCDRNGAIESCVPTTIEDPVYTVDGVLHYAVDHTPSIFYRTATNSISKEVVKYIDLLIDDKPNQILNKALIIDKGKIIDPELLKFYQS